MGGLEANLAAAALAIALVALFTAFGQVSQQYLATADGFRRCQKSVMGEYARHTRLRWRWREFRFETLYTVPKIFMVGDGAPSRIEQVLLTGSTPTRAKSLVPWERGSGASLNFCHETPQQLEARRTQNWLATGEKPGVSASHGEKVCWISLLDMIHNSTFHTVNELRLANDVVYAPPYKVRIPCIVFREKSWDFVPPDVVRPLAETTLSDISVIARRMGMKWKDFRPSDGILRAEGHSHIITSTMVRSVGIVLQYSYTGQGQRLKRADVNLQRAVTGSLFVEQEEVYIPSSKSDRLGCGVIRTEPMFDLPDFTVSTQREIVTALSYLDRSGVSSATLTKLLKENPEFRFRVADLVAFTTPSIRTRSLSLVQVPAPSDNVHGITTSPVGRQAFRIYLGHYIDSQPEKVGQVTQHALEICQDFSTKYTDWDHVEERTSHSVQWVVRRDKSYLDTLQETMLTLTDQLNGYESPLRYADLLALHMRLAMFCEGGETSILRNWGTNYEADVEGYFKQLPNIVAEMEKKGVNRLTCIDMWCTMMVRGMCWGACHFFVPGERVPVQYYGSQLPVFIG